MKEGMFATTGLSETEQSSPRGSPLRNAVARARGGVCRMCDFRQIMKECMMTPKDNNKETDTYFTFHADSMAKTAHLLLHVAVILLASGIVTGQFFVNLGDKQKQGGGTDVASGSGSGDVAAGDQGAATQSDQQAQLQEDWTAFVKWFRSNGGIISSKLTVKVPFRFGLCFWVASFLTTCVGQKWKTGSLLQGAHEEG
eukprot:754657-Hanusia_phi.AAC.3